MSTVVSGYVVYAPRPKWLLNIAANGSALSWSDVGHHLMVADNERVAFVSFGHTPSAYLICYKDFNQRHTRYIATQTRHRTRLAADVITRRVSKRVPDPAKGRSCEKSWRSLREGARVIVRKQSRTRACHCAVLLPLSPLQPPLSVCIWPLPEPRPRWARRIAAGYHWHHCSSEVCRSSCCSATRVATAARESVRATCLVCWVSPAPAAGRAVRCAAHAHRRRVADASAQPRRAHIIYVCVTRRVGGLVQAPSLTTETQDFLESWSQPLAYGRAWASSSRF